jgi:hypothetical protein
MKLTTLLHLVTRLKNAWSYTTTPRYACMVWCSVIKEHTDNFNFAFTFTVTGTKIITMHYFRASVATSFQVGEETQFKMKAK